MYCFAWETDEISHFKVKSYPLYPHGITLGWTTLEFLAIHDRNLPIPFGISGLTSPTNVISALVDSSLEFSALMDLPLEFSALVLSRH